MTWSIQMLLTIASLCGSQQYVNASDRLSCSKKLIKCTEKKYVDRALTAWEANFSEAVVACIKEDNW